jgi:hypothetical protein
MYRPFLLLLAACDVDAGPDTAAEDTTQDVVATTDLCPVLEPCVAIHSERDLDGDGARDERTARTYNENLAQLSFEKFDADDVLLERAEFTYVGDREQSGWFDTNGDGTAETTYELTWTDFEDGTFLAAMEQFSTDGPSVLGSITYDANFRPVESTFTQTLGSESVSYTDTWTYDARGHELVHRYLPDPPGEPFEELSSWDAEGRAVGWTFRYLDDDSPTDSTTTTWDGCNKTSTSRLNDGEVTHCTFTYDDLGRRTSYICRNKGGALGYNESWTWDAEREYRVTVDQDGDEQPEYVNHHVKDERGNTLLFEQVDAEGVLLTSTAATWICP